MVEGVPRSLKPSDAIGTTFKDFQQRAKTMKVIYTKEEVQKIMHEHYVRTHSYIDDKRPITGMTMTPQRITIELGPVPEDKDDD